MTQCKNWRGAAGSRRMALPFVRARLRHSGLSANRPVLLVPGRLDAALAVWLLIGRHLVAKLAGGKVEDMPTILSLRRKVTSTIGMTEVIPVRCSGGMAEPLGSEYLSLTALTRSDGWILVPAESEGFAAGSEVAVNQWP